MSECTILILNIIETALLTATLTVLIIYTKETYKLRKATVEHNELVNRPCLTMIKSLNKFPKLKNIGHGTAINISIQIIRIGKVNYLEIKNGIFYVKWDYVNKHLMPTEDTDVGHYFESENKKLERILKNFGANAFGFPFFVKETGVREYDLEISYNDISNISYSSKVHFDCEKKKIELIESHKVNSK